MLKERYSPQCFAVRRQLCLFCLWFLWHCVLVSMCHLKTVSEDLLDWVFYFWGLCAIMKTYFLTDELLPAYMSLWEMWSKLTIDLISLYFTTLTLPERDLCWIHFVCNKERGTSRFNSHGTNKESCVLFDYCLHFSACSSLRVPLDTGPCHIFSLV